MRLLENWTRPRPGEPVVGFVVALEQGRLLCLGEDEMAVRFRAWEWLGHRALFREFLPKGDPREGT